MNSRDMLGPNVTSSSGSRLSVYYLSKESELKQVTRIQNRENINETRSPETNSIGLKSDVHKRTDFIILFEQLINIMKNCDLNNVKREIELLNPLSEQFCLQQMSIQYLIDASKKNEFFDILYEIYEIFVKNAFFEMLNICNNYNSFCRLLMTFERPFTMGYIPDIYKFRFEELIETVKRYNFEKHIEFKENFKTLLQDCFRNKKQHELVTLYEWSKNLLDYDEILYSLFCEKISLLFESLFQKNKLHITLIEANSIETLISSDISSDFQYYNIHILGYQSGIDFSERIDKFIKIEKVKHLCTQSYDICMAKGHVQKEILSELKVSFEKDSQYATLFGSKLKEALNKNIFTKSHAIQVGAVHREEHLEVLTTDVLYIYVKLINAMRYLGASSNSIKHLIFPSLVEKLKSRPDIASVLCLSIFEDNLRSILNENSVLLSSPITNTDILTSIKAECTDSALYDYKGEADHISFSEWFERSYLTWKPEPVKASFKEENKVTKNYNYFLERLERVNTHDNFKDQEKSTLHYLSMTIFPQNKSSLLHEFVNASSYLFLSPIFTIQDFYSWEEAMRSVLSILAHEDISAADNDSPVTSLLQNLQIMVNDYHSMCRNQSSSLFGLSSSYWNVKSQPSYSKIGEVLKTSLYQNLYSDLCGLFRMYASANIGQKINILYDKSFLDVRLTFDDNRVLEKTVPFLSGMLIQHIASSAKNQSFDIDSLKQTSSFISFSDELLEEALDYWVSYFVLAKDKEKFYYIIENLQEHLDKLPVPESLPVVGILLSKNDTSPKTKTKPDITDLLKKHNVSEAVHAHFEPLITGLLQTKRKPLSFSSLQSWLSLSLPLKNGINITSLQLQNYIQCLVDADVLVRDSSGFYRLAAKKRKHSELSE